MQNAYFIAKLSFDTTENEPAKKLQKNIANLQNFAIVDNFALVAGVDVRDVRERLECVVAARREKSERQPERLLEGGQAGVRRHESVRVNRGNENKLARGVHAHTQEIKRNEIYANTSLAYI